MARLMESVIVSAFPNSTPKLCMSPRPTPGPIANRPVAIIYRMCEAEFFLKYIANAQKMANEI